MDAIEVVGAVYFLVDRCENSGKRFTSEAL